MSNKNEKGQMNLARVNLNTEHQVKEKPVTILELSEGSEGTIFKLLDLPDLEKREKSK